MQKRGGTTNPAARVGGTVEDLQALAASGKRFPVNLVDLPWLFHTCSGKGKQRSAERYYDCMSLEDIKALPIGDLAADDCAVFLWSVCPDLPGALDVDGIPDFLRRTRPEERLELASIRRP